MNSISELCESVLSIIKGKVSSTMYNLWFANVKIESFSNEEAVFSIDSDFKKEFIEKGHMDLISSSLAEAVGIEVPCSIISTQAENGFKIPDFSSNDNYYAPEEEKKPLYPVYNDEKKIDTASAIESHMIVEEYTFDNFIVGDSNKFAHAACTAVAKNSSSEYNPLFIWGQSGLGKTHLLYAVTNEIKRIKPNVKIIYKKCEEFTNELISAISTSTTYAFREKYRSADVLLIDDIQFIAGKESTQEEFFHTFTALYESGKQIILTSDRPPKEITPLSERLRTRFE
ncbi:MAG: ATP-binding protein, partial [Clostridia bacterium]|nr:ATP-binding protein [Clostridia bacterium]